jgi:hypothetical protein
VFFLFPDTTFERQQVVIPITHDEVRAGEPSLADESKESKVSTYVDYGVGSTVPAHLPFWRRALGLETLQIKNQSRLPRDCVTPILLLCHPAVVWGSAIWSVVFIWVFIQGAVADQVYRAPRYNMSTVAVSNLMDIAPEQ